MEGLLYLIPVALLLGLVGLAAFLWSLRSGQFDDLDGAAQRVLFDDDADAVLPPDEEKEARRRQGTSEEPPRESSET